MTNILIVDDNDNNRLTLDLLLEHTKDVLVSEATNGKEAVAMCEKKVYDLIFMDIMMPIMDGIEATILIKDIQKSSMIIALSALDDTESKQHMILAGAEDYLTKPIDSELFTQRVKNYINIINLRGNATVNKNSNNPFTNKTYKRRFTSFIDSEEAIVEFWDFCLKANQLNCIDLSDYIRIVYGFSRWLLKLKEEFTIDIEGNDVNIFIMLNGINKIKKRTILKLVNKHIPDAIFIVKNNTLSFKLIRIEKSKKEITILGDETKNILSKTHIDNQTAQEYVEQTAISIIPKIDSLEKTEHTLDDLIISFERNPSKDTRDLICNEFDKYYSVVELLSEFEHLIYAIKTLIEFLRSLGEDQFKSDKLKDFVSQLLNLLNDLSNWREIIFIKQEAIDIHYLDSSLLSSCLQLETIFEDNKEVDEGDDLEFF